MRSVKHDIKPNVMVIIAADFVSGPAKGVFQLMQSLKSLECFLHLYNFKTASGEPRVFIQEARKWGIGCLLFHQRRRSYLYLLRQAGSEVAKKNINIVQTHGFKPTIIGFYLKYRYRIKWICFLHGRTTENMKVRAYHALDSFVQLFADRVVLVSQDQRKRFPLHCSRHKHSVIPNAVDLDHPVRLSSDRVPVRLKHGLPSSAKIALYVGRLSPEKGVDVLINCFPNVLTAVPEAHAIIVGDGPHRRQLERLCKSRGLRESVHFVGFSETPGNYILESDVLVLPSRSEGIPNVILEAMALEKPVIATSVGGTPDVVENGLSGILVSSEDVDGLSTAIIRILTTEGLGMRLAAEGLLRVGKFFSPEVRARAVYGIYQELLFPF